MFIEIDNDRVKYSCSEDDHAKSRDQDAGASNLAKADHASEKENAAKFTSGAKLSRSDASYNNAQSSWPDLCEVPTQASNQLQTSGNPTSATISSTYGLED